jgi:membrane associated rhomboid family serine protease
MSSSRASTSSRSSDPPVPPTSAETDPSVCYRHPDRTSWTLCERCGRTICPECQILTPQGVRCPECVREVGGSVQWTPAAARPAAKKRGMRAPRPAQQIASRVDAATRPVITIAVAATAVALWLLGYVTNNLPYAVLGSSPVYALEVWRYATTALVYPAGGGPSVLAVLIGIAIFVWIGWNAERFFGWRRYLLLVVVSGIAAAAVAGIALSATAGLMGAVWGVIGGYLIAVWSQPAARNRMLITMVFWLLFSLFFGNIFAAIGGAGGGIGATLLLRRFEGAPAARASTPYWLIAGGVAGLVLLAVLASVVIAPRL